MLDFAFARLRVVAVTAIAYGALIGAVCAAAVDGAGGVVFAAGVAATAGCGCYFSAGVVTVAFAVSAATAAAVLLLRFEAFDTGLRVVVVVVLQGELFAAYAVHGGAVAA